MNLLASRQLSLSFKGKPSNAIKENGQSSKHEDREELRRQSPQGEKRTPGTFQKATVDSHSDGNSSLSKLQASIHLNDRNVVIADYLRSKQDETFKSQGQANDTRYVHSVPSKVRRKKPVRDSSMEGFLREIQVEPMPEDHSTEISPSEKQRTTKTRRQRNPVNNNEAEFPDNVASSQDFVENKKLLTNAFTEDETTEELQKQRSSSRKLGRKRNAKTKSELSCHKIDVDHAGGDASDDPNAFISAHSETGEVLRAPVVMKQASMRSSRITRRPMLQKQKSERAVSSCLSSSQQQISQQNLLSRSSHTFEQLHKQRSEVALHEQRSELALASRYRSDSDLQKHPSRKIQLGPKRTNSPDATNTRSSNWEQSGEIKQSRPTFRKQFSEIVFRSRDGLLESLQKQISCEPVSKPTNDKDEPEKRSEENTVRSKSGRPVFPKQQSELALDKNDKSAKGVQKPPIGAAVPPSTNKSNNVRQHSIQTIPKSMLEQKLNPAWRKEPTAFAPTQLHEKHMLDQETIGKSLPSDDESAMTEYMRLIEEKYGEKAQRPANFMLPKETDDHDDESAITDYMNMIEATYGDPPEVPLGMLAETTERDESEATSHESDCSSGIVPKREPKVRRASLSHYLGSIATSLPALHDHSEVAQLEPRNTVRRASLSDYIASNVTNAAVSVQSSLITVISNETG